MNQIACAEIAHIILDKDLMVGEVWTLKSFRDAGLGQERSSAALLSGFGVLAVALAGIGLYGVLAFAVARRRHEVGIRMALGASRSNVIRLVTGQGVALTLAGLVLGLFVIDRCQRIALVLNPAEAESADGSTTQCLDSSRAVRNRQGQSQNRTPDRHMAHLILGLIPLIPWG